jgi:phospholipid/cholesterol/gamma-HCH transport system substrate-binding protein
MDHRVSKPALAFALICAIAAALTFVYLNEAFEGPSLTATVDGEPYELEARFANAEALPTKQPVLIRGVEVGKVTEVRFERESATAVVRFSVDDEYRPIHRDASVAIGERTLLGDPYLNLDPGSDDAEEAGVGERITGLPSVDFDEALDFLDASGRRDARALIDSLGEASAPAMTGERLNSTTAQLSRTVGELRVLTAALRGQRDDLSALVRDGSVVLGELGSREQALRDIVGSGRMALEALAQGEDSLERGVAELPGLLDAGRAALDGARPLVAEARPVIAELRRGAPDLTAILGDAAPLFGDAVDVIGGLAAVPSLREALELVTLAGPVAPKLAPAARNLVATLRYTAPRADAITAFFANFAGVTAHGNGQGKWSRFSILFEPGELLDLKTPAICQPEDDLPVNTGFCHNAYPAPQDALDNEPYEPGSYPRLEAFDPPR